MFSKYRRCGAWFRSETWTLPQLTETQSENARSTRIVYLEATRGVASIIVMIHHFALAFWPILKVEYPEGLAGTPLYWMVSGEAAVMFFFVLSGFVLALKYYRAPSLIGVALAALKRLPRLLVPASITVLIGWLILKSGLHWNEQAASITGSDWLKTFANGLPPETHSLTIWSAFHQCFSIFLVGTPYFYNSSLWTMSYEFYGSILVFLIVGVTMRNFRRVAVAVLLGLLMTFFYWQNIFYLTFVVGCAIAFVHTNFRHPAIRNDAVSIALACLALVVISSLTTGSQIAGAALLIAALLLSPKLGALLSGKIGRWLGRISFPLYLVHVLVILSCSSYVFTKTVYYWPSSSLPYVFAGLVTVGVSLLAALPLMQFDAWWVRVTNAVARRFGAALANRFFAISQNRKDSTD